MALRFPLVKVLLDLTNQLLACTSLGTGTKLEPGHACGRLHIKHKGPYPVEIQYCSPPQSAIQASAWMFSSELHVFDCLCYTKATDFRGQFASAVENGCLAPPYLPFLLIKHMTVFLCVSFLDAAPVKRAFMELLMWGRLCCGLQYADIWKSNAESDDTGSLCFTREPQSDPGLYHNNSFVWQPYWSTQSKC